MQVMASDADDPTYGSSARVVYSVLEGEQHFTVDSKTGEQQHPAQGTRLQPHALRVMCVAMCQPLVLGYSWHRHYWMLRASYIAPQAVAWLGAEPAAGSTVQQDLRLPAWCSVCACTGQSRAVPRAGLHPQAHQISV